MRLDRRTRIALLVIPVLLAGLVGGLYAACGPCPASGAMPCCQPSGAPVVKAPPCCQTLEKPAPVPDFGTVEPSVSAPAAAAVPFALPAEPPAEPPVAVPPPPPVPPRFREGAGLYTLHSVFLI